MSDYGIALATESGPVEVVKPRIDERVTALEGKTETLEQSRGNTDSFGLVKISDGLDSTDGVVKVKLGEGLSFDDNKAIMAKISGMAIGSIFPFAGATAPYGSLVCDGSAVSRETYAKLFEAIGTLHGEGDGSTTFNLPNYIGKTFWGGLDVGTVKEAGLPNIEGNFACVYRNNSLIQPSSGAFYDVEYPASVGRTGGGANTHDIIYGINLDASLSNPIYGKSSTVQPPAVVTLPCIKAFDTIAESATIQTEQLASDLANLLTKVQILENAKFVTETWSEDNAWCRVYNDGWIEQGGLVQSINGTKTITMHKAFANTNYTLVKNLNDNAATGTSAPWLVSINCFNKTRQTFDIREGAVFTLSYYACGY